jgi:hypothetical protein
MILNKVKANGQEPRWFLTKNGKVRQVSAREARNLLKTCVCSLKDKGQAVETYVLEEVLSPDLLKDRKGGKQV